MKRGKRLGKILSLRPIRLCNSETGKERRLPQIVGNKGKFHLLVESAEKQKEERSDGGGGLIKELDKEESKLDLLNGRPRANYRDFGLYGHILREILNASSLLAVAVEVDTDRASYTTLLRSGAASFQGVPVLFDEMEELIVGSGSWGNEKKRCVLNTGPILTASTKHWVSPFEEEGLMDPTQSGSEDRVARPSPRLYPCNPFHGLFPRQNLKNGRERTLTHTYSSNPFCLLRPSGPALLYSLAITFSWEILSLAYPQALGNPHQQSRERRTSEKGFLFNRDFASFNPFQIKVFVRPHSSTYEIAFLQLLSRSGSSLPIQVSHSSQDGDLGLLSILSSPANLGFLPTSDPILSFYLLQPSTSLSFKRSTFLTECGPSLGNLNSFFALERTGRRGQDLVPFLRYPFLFQEPKVEEEIEKEKVAG
ncbi:ribosomal protein S14 [Cucumis melo var. makuwa]|uniref:Ribosomal protein S14 (Chloroplast) n=1 Tax=Cucumis melo var. makuwa TaxID=1194695 RepID=A0A5A7SQW9_CUCMM|nr:ribosomal protein S14 [Cucumis melo var. makuwa]